VYKDCEPKGIRNDKFITRVKAILPSFDTAVIRQHDTWLRASRLHAQKKSERLLEYNRKRDEQVEIAKKAFSEALTKESTTTLREEEMRRRQEAQEILHAKVNQFKIKRDARLEIQMYQEEIARLEAEKIREDYEVKRQKDHEIKKKLLQEHK